jgi:membrane protease YdiL (CAAX protease family)
MTLGVAPATAVELLFLAVYAWWLTGLAPGPWKAQRVDLGRGERITRAAYVWGPVAAIAFAVTVHAAIVLLFRFIPFPAEAFHAGYDFSFIPTLQLKWLACVVSALSAGVCEEMGFRGYMQRPIEKRRGPWVAILVSSLIFMLVHLNKSWSLAAMTPIVFGAGLMLGALARASKTLVFCILGHTLMDVGLFAYWWTQIAGVFSQRPISETGLDVMFLAESAIFLLALATFVVAVRRLSSFAGTRPSPQPATG